MANTSPLKYDAGVITIRADKEFRDALESVRRSLDPIPSKSDAIRQLVLERSKQLERKRTNGK